MIDKYFLQYNPEKKLILCTNNFKIGDKVIDEYSGERIEYEVVETPQHYHRQVPCGISKKLMNTNPIYLSQHTYKEIGPVSSDASEYASKLDIVSKENVQFQISSYPPYEGFFEVSEDEYILANTFAKRIRIKGPCGHFH